MSEPKVRLADIAKDTGYSLATVSKALNGRSDISDEARAAIDRALKATGYQRRGQKTATRCRTCRTGCTSASRRNR